MKILSSHRNLHHFALTVAAALQGVTALPYGAASTQCSSSSEAASFASLSYVAPIVDCASLLSVDLTDIGGAGSNISAAATTTSNGISYCSVTGELPPAIGWQVLLPVATWAQRYMQSGCGGLCGSISTSPSVAYGNELVNNGTFVLAGTNMDGGSDGLFGLDRDKRVAFAYGAQHKLALLSKKLIKAYYGQDAKYSYFNGCSDGGREAVMEALRYPDDFDGILAGAPAFLFQFQNSLHHGYLAVSNTNADGTHKLLSSRLSIIHQAVMDACDGLDGLADGLLSDPRLCTFDPATIQCKDDAGDTTSCLTSDEVSTINAFYNGPHDPVSGLPLTVGEEQRGAELAWNGVCVGSTATASVMSSSIALAALPNLILDTYPGANYTLADLVFANSTIDLLRARHPLLDAVSADLSPFRSAGHKLILYHGWADPHISPRTTIAYYEALQKHMGVAAVDEFVRLYLLPGMYHCGDGYGPSYFDLVSPILAWVEGGVAPFAVNTSTVNPDGSTATGTGGAGGAGGPPTGATSGATGGASVTATATGSSVAASTTTAAAMATNRPVYPYPMLPKYTGSGSLLEAANFVAGEPLYTQKTAFWLGQDFFDPYTPIEG
ncbi:Tannase/feruloyl esterase [Zopfochytrium polystomum]|nr:Tannase/feruloyl esterase [Zopfochytrium polystomum]